MSHVAFLNTHGGSGGGSESSGLGGVMTPYETLELLVSKHEELETAKALLEQVCNTHCNTRCNTLQRTATHVRDCQGFARAGVQYALQHVLQHTATHCNALQRAL